jgi:hypothetical protein
MKPRTTVPFVRFATQAFDAAKNRPTPVPTNQNDITTTGNGGVHIRATYPMLMKEHAVISIRERPRAASRGEIIGDEVINPRA